MSICTHLRQLRQRSMPDHGPVSGNARSATNYFATHQRREVAAGSGVCLDQRSYQAKKLGFGASSDAMNHIRDLELENSCLAVG
jgi:hypothetical protein